MLHEVPPDDIVAVGDACRLLRSRCQQDARVLDAAKRKDVTMCVHIEGRAFERATVERGHPGSPAFETYIVDIRVRNDANARGFFQDAAIHPREPGRGTELVVAMIDGGAERQERPSRCFGSGSRVPFECTNLERLARACVPRQ
jgi:hypothetical protein